MTQARSPKDFPWHEPHWAARFMELANEGCTYSNIAAVLSKESGRHVTRSAVSGRFKRLNIEMPAKEGDGRGKVTALKKKQALPLKPGRLATFIIPSGFGGTKHAAERKPPNPPELSHDQKEAILGQGVVLLDLKPHHCRWIITDFPRFGEHLYCGETKIEGGSSYCPYHEDVRRFGSVYADARRKRAA